MWAVSAFALILGWLPGANRAGKSDHLGMTRHSKELHLSIEIDSDPIAGLVSVDTGDPRGFCGWMELVAAIEAVRHQGQPGAASPAVEVTRA
jgi:hypothetical protein